MKEEILKICLEKGILLDKEMSDIFSKLNLEEVRALVERISKWNEKIITKSFFSQNVDKISSLIKDNTSDQEIIEKLRVHLGLSFEVTRKKLEKKEIAEEEAEREEDAGEGLGNVKIISSVKIKTKKIEVGDFVKHFKSRLSFLKGVLQERADLENLVSINKISGSRQNISIIGMVYAKRLTKNKNILLELEDLTGRISVLVNCNKPEIYEIAKNIILDDVIAVKGTGNREILFVNNIFYPEARIHERLKLDRDESAAFISDLHVGSNMFLEKNLLKFIDWLNGKVGDESQRKEALKVKYLFITGDSIDGVAVFPGQEKFLSIKDIRAQYAKLAEILNKIRKDVTIIMCPGQHDSVWLGEPQPPIDKDYGAALFDINNLILVSNPGLVEIKNNFGRGLRILMYHGASFHSFISEIESLRLEKAHDNPSKIVKEVLKRRHLASFHSSVTYTPDGVEDRLMIKQVPDIILTGDMHRPDVDIYNNILIICSSCWQSITPFEEKVGNHPDPCKVPVLNLKTRQIKILDFSDISEVDEIEK